MGDRQQEAQGRGPEPERRPDGSGPLPFLRVKQGPRHLKNNVSALLSSNSHPTQPAQFAGDELDLRVPTGLCSRHHGQECLHHVKEKPVPSGCRRLSLRPCAPWETADPSVSRELPVLDESQERGPAPCGLRVRLLSLSAFSRAAHVVASATASSLSMAVWIAHCCPVVHLSSGDTWLVPAVCRLWAAPLWTRACGSQSGHVFSFTGT